MNVIPERLSAAQPATANATVIVIPTLNEAGHIRHVLEQVAPFALRHQARVVVVDGGSEDGTREIVREMARDWPALELQDNPDKLQSAGINRAVANAGEAYLIRIDAHGEYPPDYCDILLDEAARMGADSVVVSMRTRSRAGLQEIIAHAQSSIFGNGGSRHRRNPVEGRWVDHGHHALMRIEPFRQVGGYDPTFAVNEDAELDHRLTAAGHRIWLTGRTDMIYFPRSTLGGLMRQYYAYGYGRASTMLKHRMVPALRQLIVASVAPLLALVVLAPLSWLFAVPLLGYIAVCIGAGLVIAADSRLPIDIAAGPVAGLMQLSWSVGFWTRLLTARRARA